MLMPRLNGHFNNREQNAERGQKSLGALPVLLMALHAPLQFRDASAVTVAHQPSHLCLQYAKSLNTCASNSFIIRIRRTPRSPLKNRAAD